MPVDGLVVHLERILPLRSREMGSNPIESTGKEIKKSLNLI